MSSERAATDGAGEAASDGDRVVSVLGLEVAIEEDFVGFPWRAGLVRGPAAFAITVALVVLVASVGGLGRGPLVDQLSLVGLVAYNAHAIPAALGLIPGAAAPAAEAVTGVPVLGRAVRGLFVVGQNHAAPLAHVLDVAGGTAPGSLGHVNFIERQGRTEVPSLVYYLIPALVLVLVGWDYAATHWDEAATDSPIELSRFGIALGAGYVVAMLVGTVLITVEMSSPLSGQSYVVLPDRYLTAVFGFAYPAILGTVGAGVAALQRGDDDAAGDENETG